MVDSRSQRPYNQEVSLAAAPTPPLTPLMAAQFPITHHFPLAPAPPMVPRRAGRPVARRVLRRIHTVLRQSLVSQFFPVVRRNGEHVESWMDANLAHETPAERTARLRDMLLMPPAPRRASLILRRFPETQAEQALPFAAPSVPAHHIANAREVFRRAAALGAALQTYALRVAEGASLSFFLVDRSLTYFR